MMKFKKFLAATMTTAMIFGTVAMAVPVTNVYAAAPAIGNDKVNYEDFTIEVTPVSNDKVVFLEVLKTNDEDSKVSATYCFVTSAKTTIDLSFLKATKEQYIRFYGSNGERSDIITIAAQPQKFTAKFSLKSTTADSFAGKGFDATKIASSGYQYKGLYASEWNDMKDLTVAMLQNLSVTGTTLVLRTKAVKASSLASAEVKVKISAAAKAPKVKIDYAKGEVSTGKGMEYSTDASAWTDISAAKLSVADFLSGASVTDTTKDSVIYVRTKATDKKAASNITLVTIPKATKFADGTPADTSTVYNNASIAMSDEASNKITFKTVVNKDDDSKATLEIKAEGASFDFSTDGGKTWKTVKAGKTFSVEQTAQTITVRRSGDKAKELLPSTPSNYTIKAYAKSNS